MSRSLPQRHRTVKFLAHAQGVVKLARYGGVGFKQRAVYWMYGSEGIGKEHSQPVKKMCTVSMLLIKALLH